MHRRHLCASGRWARTQQSHRNTKSPSKSKRHRQTAANRRRLHRHLLPQSKPNTPQIDALSKCTAAESATIRDSPRRFGNHRSPARPRHCPRNTIPPPTQATSLRQPTRRRKFRTVRALQSATALPMAQTQNSHFFFAVSSWRTRAPSGVDNGRGTNSTFQLCLEHTTNGAWRQFALATAQKKRPRSTRAPVFRCPT